MYTSHIRNCRTDLVKLCTGQARGGGADGPTELHKSQTELKDFLQRGSPHKTLERYVTCRVAHLK